MDIRKRTLALLLASCMLTVPACSEKAADSAEDSAKTSSGITALPGENEELPDASEEPDPLADALPEKDMGGWTFRMSIFGNGGIRAETYAEEMNGNVVNDAVYTKIANVGDRFNVDIVLTEACLDDGNDQAVLLKSIAAGEDSCEIAQGHDISMANASLEGDFINVYDLPYLDFEKPWWPDATLESMTVLGQMYLMFNNISYENLTATRVMYFNKSLMTDMGFAYPYETVYEGTWTLDEIRNLSDSAYIDLNGNGKRDAFDQYGFVSPTYFYCCMEPFCLEPYRKDENGGLYYSMDVERTSELVEKFYNLLFGEGGFKNSYDTVVKLFSDGRAMFDYSTLGDAVNKFNVSEVVYGILPMPKLNEEQDQYYGGSTDRPIAVPITVDPANLDSIGLVVEALNAEGYRNVYPAVYEITMKNRYADQTDDAKMLDIIHDNTIISFTYLFGNFASAYNKLFETLFNAGTPNTNVASWKAANNKVQTKYVAKLMKFFTAHADTVNP